jgi:hypothetical protein
MCKNRRRNIEDKSDLWFCVWLIKVSKGQLSIDIRNTKIKAINWEMFYLTLGLWKWKELFNDEKASKSYIIKPLVNDSITIKNF